MNRIPFDQVQQTLKSVLEKLGMSAKRSQVCARLFCETTRDGVYTHGINRFPRFVETIRNGKVDVKAEPKRVSGHGALERWDGQRGVGNLNALGAMERAITLGREHGIGCVALGNTNHWMRAGTYGWQAAGAGVIGICWTNTMPNLPPWGGVDPIIGNNPLVIAVPRAGGAVVRVHVGFSADGADRLRQAVDQPLAGGPRTRRRCSRSRPARQAVGGRASSPFARGCRRHLRRHKAQRLSRSRRGHGDRLERQRHAARL